MPPSSSTSAALETAIRRLYTAFARYAATSLTTFSLDAGITAADVARLRARPLRELTGADLDRFARSALTTWGGVDDFKHFLPRIFELLVREPGRVDALVVERLALADWRTWPVEEQEVVEAFLAALWCWALEVGPDVVDAGSILRAVGLAGCALDEWLDTWRDAPGLAATRQLAHLAFLEQDALVTGGLVSSWHPRDRLAVLAFLREKSSLRRVEEAFLAYPDGAAGRELAAAADVLAALGQAARADET